MQSFDIIVVGAGAAGLTAAITAARSGLSVAVLDSLGPGGQAMNAARVDNWPGLPQGIAGIELGLLLFDQATTAGAEIILDTVTALSDEGDARTYIVHGSEDRYRARAVIIAAGSVQRSLGVPGEARLLGRGVSHCATCDGPLYRGKRVAVIGGGDSAVDAAICLAEFAARVTLHHREVELSGQRQLIDRLKSRPNIKVCPRTVIDEIIGDDTVQTVRVRDLAAGRIADEPVDAVFVHIGPRPNTGILRGVLDLDAGGHIVTDIMLRTSKPGIYAAGDIRAGSVALFAAASGDGATAAIAAWRDLTARR